MTAKELCTLISVCRKNGILFFKEGDLKFRFQPTETGLTASAEGRQIPDALQSIESTDIKKIEADQLLSDTVTMRQDQLALLAIEDPEEYESLLSTGDLKDDERQSGEQDDR